MSNTILPTCNARLPRQHDIDAASQPRPATDPAAGADALAVRCDRYIERAVRWAGHCGTQAAIIERLRAVANRRQHALQAARAEAQAQRMRVDTLNGCIDQMDDILTEALEVGEKRESELRREVEALRSALLEQDREDRERKACRARKARAKRIAAACRAVQGEDDLTPQIRTGLRALVGAINVTPVVLIPKGKPRLTGVAGHHLTEGGAICHHPSAYRRAHGRTIYIPSTEQIEVSAAWIRTHAPTVVQAAMR